MKKGFTFVELVVGVAIVAIFGMLISLNSLRARSKANLDAVAAVLQTDLKSQQNKAMSGTTDGGNVVDGWGIFFESDRYTLFPGAVYDSGNPSNVVHAIPEGITLSTTAPENTVVFEKLSGDVMGATNPTYDIVLDGGGQVTLTYNKRGVITAP